jgi:hypothetical protein
MNNTPYLRLVRIVRISPRLNLKEINPQRIDGLKGKISKLQGELANSAQMEDEKQRLAEENRCRYELKLATDALTIAERSFPDILLVLTVQNISLFDRRIPVTSRLVPIDDLYGIDYYDPYLLKVLKEKKVLENPINNVYTFNEDVGTYEDLNCGGIYQRRTVFTFSYKETPRSDVVELKFVQKTIPGSDEPAYYPLVSGGHIGFIKNEYVVDNPQYTLLRFADEILPNTGSILCAREADAEGNVNYFGVNMDGTKGQLIEFPGGEEIREKLRTPYNEGEVL